MNWLRRIFCRHEWRHYANLYGDQINSWGGKRSVWECSHCGTLQARDAPGGALDPTTDPRFHGLPAYPEGDVVGPCVCGSWPGGKCLRCPVTPNVRAERPETAREKL